MPAPEAKLWSALRELRARGHHFRRQVQIGAYYVDFLCHRSRLAIEIDGDTHFVGGAQNYDRRRDQRIAADGFRVMRFTNDDVMTNPDGVLEAIQLVLADTPTLDPSPQGGGRRESR